MDREPRKKREKLPKPLNEAERKKRASVAVVEWRRRRKLNAIKYKGGKCIGCGYDRYYGALVFHHVDPSQKLFVISNKGICNTWSKVKPELDKCVLLCVVCHNEVHAGWILLNKDGDTVTAQRLDEPAKDHPYKDHNNPKNFKSLTE